MGFYSFFSFFIFFLILFFFPCVPQGIYLSSIISFVLRAAVCEHALRQRCSDKSGERFAWRCFDMFKVSYSITLGMEGAGAGAENGKAKQEVLPDVVLLRRNMQWKNLFFCFPAWDCEARQFFCARECNYWFSKKKKKKCSFQRIQIALISRKIHTAALGLFKRHRDESVSGASTIFSFILISFALNVFLFL